MLTVGSTKQQLDSATDLDRNYGREQGAWRLGLALTSGSGLLSACVPENTNVLRTNPRSIRKAPQDLILLS
jgi:hypothetical protein